MDIAIIEDGKVVLVRRGKEPFEGCWVFPGGFVDYGEIIEDAAVREALEETGLNVEVLAILGVYSSPDRDPRKHTISTVFIAYPTRGKLAGGDDAAEAKWFEIESIEAEDLAFDHGRILEDLKRWIKQPDTFWSTKDTGKD